METSGRPIAPKRFSVVYQLASASGSRPQPLRARGIVAHHPDDGPAVLPWHGRTRLWALVLLLPATWLAGRGLDVLAALLG